MELQKISLARRVEPFASPADQRRFAADQGLVYLPPNERFPLHSGRGTKPEWWRRVWRGGYLDTSDPEWLRYIRWVAPEIADTPFVLGDRIGPLPTDPLSVDRYQNAAATLFLEPVPPRLEERVVQDLLARTPEEAMAAQVFSLDVSDRIRAERYTDYVEPRGFSSAYWTARARISQAWSARHPRRFAADTAMPYEPSSLAAAQAARRAGRLALRDQILERHLRTIPALVDYTELSPGDVEAQFVHGGWGWREMTRALESGWTLVDADHPRALDSFAAATDFILWRTTIMNAELRALEERGLTPEQAPLRLSAQAVLSFNRRGRNEPLWFAPEYYADAALSYALGLQRQGHSADQVTKFLDISRAALRIAAAANTLATRVVRAHVNAGQAWRLMSVRDALREDDCDLTMSWYPSGERIAAKQAIVAGISAVARTGS